MNDAELMGIDLILKALEIGDFPKDEPVIKEMIKKVLLFQIKENKHTSMNKLLEIIVNWQMYIELHYTMFLNPIDDDTLFQHHRYGLK